MIKRPEPGFCASLLAFQQLCVSQEENEKKLKANKRKIRNTYADKAASSIAAEDIALDKARRLPLEASIRCPAIDLNISGGSIIHLAKIILRQIMGFL